VEKLVHVKSMRRYYLRRRNSDPVSVSSHLSSSGSSSEVTTSDSDSDNSVDLYVRGVSPYAPATSITGTSGGSFQSPPVSGSSGTQSPVTPSTGTSGGSFQSPPVSGASRTSDLSYHLSPISPGSAESADVSVEFDDLYHETPLLTPAVVQKKRRSDYMMRPRKH